MRLSRRAVLMRDSGNAPAVEEATVTVAVVPPSVVAVAEAAYDSG